MNKENRLTGKKVLISGAGSGIGRASAIRLAREGADVAVNDIHEENLKETVSMIEDIGQNTMMLIADVSNSQQVQEMVDEYFANWDVLDILINNAGIGGVLQKVTSIDEETWDRTFNINLKSVFLMCKYFVKHMRKRKVPDDQLRGKIINMSSARGKKGRALFGAYSAAKAGVVSLTQTLALELGRKRIAVNCICPGVIATPIYGKATVEDLAEANTYEKPCFSWKPVGIAEDVANIVYFLASDDSNYMTGQSLLVTGGRQFV